MPMLIDRLKCLRCDHTWYPRGPDRPAACPRCKRYDWDKPPEKKA